MATAGTPPSTTPSNARVASNPCQPGNTAAASVSTDDSTSDTPISVLRWIDSDSSPANRIANASSSVDTDSTKLVCAGVRPKSCASSGISGCTQYSSENVENPAANSARLARR